MTDQTPETATEPDARRGAVRARRRLARTGTIMAVMALGAGGGVAAAAGAGDLLAPAGSLTSATHSVPTKDLNLHDANGTVGTVHDQLGQLQGVVGGPQAAQMRANANPAGDLTGTVTDLGGKPLSGVDLYEVSHKAIQLLGHTDDDGTFKVDCPTGPVLLTSTGLANSEDGASPTGLGKLAYQFIGAGTALTEAPVPLCGDAHPYRAEMAPAGQVSGVLKNAAGKTLADTPLTLTNVDDPQGLQLRTMTDKQGRFMFSGLPAGRYQTLAGSSPLGPVSDVTAGVPVVHDLVDTATKLTGDATGNAGDSSIPIGSLGNVGAPTSLIQGAVPAVGGLPVGGLPVGGLLPH